MKISPMDCLPIGTPVACGSLRGKVVKAEQKRDQFGAPIMLHTCRFESRIVSKFNRPVIVPLSKPITKAVNYSFLSAFP